MTNAELIKALRWCQTHGCSKCVALLESGSCKYGGAIKIFETAADALEEADKRIDGLQKLVDINTERCEALRKQLREAHESYEKHIKELEAQLPKECEFKRYADKMPNARNRYCTQCGAYLSDDEFENHSIRYCYWCGSKVKGEQDE